MKEAGGLVGQGRLGTLEGWLAKVPEDERRKEPWFLYWLGVCRFPFNPAGARDIFKEAFDLFRAADGKTGMFLSWSGAVDTAIFQNEFMFLEPWISVMDDLLAKGITPPPEVEDRMIVSMYCAVVYRRPYRDDMAEWEKKALALLRRDGDINCRFQVGIYLIVYYVWTGRFADARANLDLLLQLLETGGGTDLMRISVRNIAGVYGFFTGDCEGTMKIVDDGLALADKSGVHIWDGHLHDIKVSLYLNQGNMACAARLLKEISDRLAGVGRFDVSYFHFLASWHAMLTGDIDGASRHQNEANDLMRATGFTSCESLSALCMAEIMHEKESQHEAETYLAEAHRVARRVRSRYLEFQCLLVEANMAFGHADENRAFDALRTGLTLGREQGYFNTIVWKPNAMSRLCARALEAGIETEYVRTLIRKRNLLPDMKDVHLEDWPWPVRVYTLGRFTLVKDGAAVATSSKGQKKTLDLLKVIIALGGRDVSAEQVTDALWPETDGDSASATLRVTLHRLRQILGNDQAIQIQDSRIRLDPRFIWVDVVAFERALAGAKKAEERGRSDEAARLTEDATKLYKGLFLAHEPDKQWAAHIRERLKGRYRNAVSTVGCRLAGKGELKKAMECWRNALDVDNLAEEFYQQLMICCYNDGCRAEAVEVYHRCTKALAASLGITPSAKTQDIYRRIAV